MPALTLILLLLYVDVIHVYICAHGCLMTYGHSDCMHGCYYLYAVLEPTVYISTVFIHAHF